MTQKGLSRRTRNTILAVLAVTLLPFGWMLLVALWPDSPPPADTHLLPQKPEIAEADNGFVHFLDMDTVYVDWGNGTAGPDGGPVYGNRGKQPPEELQPLLETFDYAGLTDELLATLET